MLHLDSNRVVHFVVSEQLEAWDSCYITDGIVVVLFEELFILKRYQVLVLNPIVDLCLWFTDAGVPPWVTRLKQDTYILLFGIALTSEQPQISVKAFKLRYYFIYILSTDCSCLIEKVSWDPSTPRFDIFKATLVERNWFSLNYTFLTISSVQKKL